MKVEAVDAFPISIKAEEKLTGGTFGYASYQSVLVKVVAGGAEGWGEAMTRHDPKATALLVRDMGRGLVGGEYETPRAAWERLWRSLRIRGHTRGTDVEALSGIEIGLYDCYGKLLNKPLCRLLDEEAKAEVPVFAGSIMASRGPLGDQVRRAEGLGMAGAKVKVGFGVSEDAEILRGVRRLWPDGMIVADANGAYDSAGARRACEAFSEFDLAWFEEPVLSDDLEGYASLRGSGVKIGAGESWFAGDFEGPMEKGLVDVVEPSVSRCGGIGTEAEVGRRAADGGVWFSPMTGMNSAISVAASLHVAAAFPSVGVEYNPFANPLQTELASGLSEPREGRVRVPSSAGLGVSVDEGFLRRHVS